ncbi:MAG: zinc-binding dehydrogenase [Elusimicrobia bacterium]|nr:zinc-binding dehydrogenase [Elusimicrobiota bacterium]
MRAVFISKTKGPSGLEMRQTTDPEPGKGQVRIRVRAAGVNFADYLMTLGLYYGAPTAPFIPGYEAAGEIEKLGAGVTGWKLGQRVLAPMKYGAYAELALAEAGGVMPIPDSKGFEEAAALPVNYLTAYHALYVLGNLRPRSRVLIHGAGGGVGIAAIQLAKLRDAEIIGTASAGKHEFARSQGARHMIDYRTEDFEARVRQITGGRGVHIALDPIGGKSFRKSYACLAETGLLVCYGASSMTGEGVGSRLRSLWTYATSGLFSPLQMMLSNRGIAGLHLGRLASEPEIFIQEMTDLARLWAQGKIKPHVDAVVPAERAEEAHRRLQDRKNVGKVVLTF